MRIWNVLRCVVRARRALVVILFVALLPSASARAFGGLWSSGGAAVAQTGQRVLFVDHPDATVTAVIEIAYAGPARKFAWVIPVPSTPTVAVSSSVVLSRLAAATAPQYWVEVSVDGKCAQNELLGSAFDDMDAGSYVDPSAPDTSGGPVLTMQAGAVGPYELVEIAVDAGAADPAQVARAWLSEHGYDLTDLDSQVWTPYLQAGWHLLAFKLTSSADVGAIRPVMLTYESPLPTLPLRAAAVAAQADMPIQVWVVGPSQAIPANYASLVLNDALLDWQSGRKFEAGTLPSGGAGPFGPPVDEPRNYDALVGAAANEAQGRGFVTELAGPTSQYRERVWSANERETYLDLAQQTFEDGVEAIRAAQSWYGRWDGFDEAVEGALTLPAGVTREQFAADPEQHRGAVDTAKFLALLDEKVVKPVAETAALLARGPYLTRLFTVMSAEEMSEDPVFDYNAELAQISNVRVAKQLVRCEPTIAKSSAAPWQMELPQGGVVVGQGEAWPVGAGAMPANLKTVQLSTRGAGTVLRDNTEAIRMQLFRAGVPSGLSTYRHPQHGLVIGGSQSVRPPYQPPPRQPPPDAGAPARDASPDAAPVAAEADKRADGCAAAPAAKPDGALALTALALLLGRRRRPRGPARERSARP